MVHILLVFVLFLTACNADLSTLMAKDSKFKPQCTLFADKLVSYNPANSKGGSELGEKTLLAPDNQSARIETNAVLTIAFLGLGAIIDKEGDDISVHGTASSDAEITVYVGLESGEMVYSGTLQNGKFKIDISTASARTASVIQLVGIKGTADIDAFESIQTLCP